MNNKQQQPQDVTQLTEMAEFFPVVSAAAAGPVRVVAVRPGETQEQAVQRFEQLKQKIAAKKPH
jgi:hypothetical protein